jgi:glycosyltransferase involved in cell wall biosynthesis
MKNKKIFIGPCEIAGYYSNLANGFSEIGVTCEYLTYNYHPYQYGGESKNYHLIRLIKFFNKLKSQFSKKSIILKILMTIPAEFLSLIWGIFAIINYDIFIFGFGKSLLPLNLDLSILKFFNKIVILNIGHGSESRPPYIDGYLNDKVREKKISTSTLFSLTKKIKSNIKNYEKNVTYIIGSPFSTSQFTNKKFINFFSIGVPIINEKKVYSYRNQYKIEPLSTINKKCRILHSPSHPIAKGTHLITNAIENLKMKGYSIELIFLTGKPHTEVVKEILLCDFVVDQVYSDTPMAGFATEAAVFGKPAIVGGYKFDYLKKFVNNEIWPPSKICKPDEIEDNIEQLILNRNEREQIGIEAQKFVQKNWNSAQVASRYLQIIQNNIPDEWYINPKEVIYTEGCCQSICSTINKVKNLVNEFGVESLQLNHNPKLEKEFLKLIN